MQMIQTVPNPQTALCRAFCRHFATMTGMGFADGRPTPNASQKDGDND